MSKTMAILIEAGGEITTLRSWLAVRLDACADSRTGGAVTDLAQHHRATAFLADALFCSDLKIGRTPSEQEMSAAIRSALKAYRNWDGCTRAVTAAFCVDLTSATRREAWCRQFAEQALGSDDAISALGCAE